MAAAVAAMLAATGCSDSNSWEAGPEDAATQVAYFTPLDSYEYLMTVEDELTIPVTVSRLTAEGAVSVPLTLTTEASGITIPASVDFADGEQTATFEVDCSGAPQKQKTSFTISIPDNLFATYGAGMQALTLSVNITDWETYIDNVDIVFENVWNPIKTTIEHMPGTDRYRLPNFINSGIDLPFRIGNNSVFLPYENVASYAEVYGEEDSYNCSYLYDRAAGAFPAPFSPDGESTTLLNYIYWYGYTESTVYSYINFAAGYGRIQAVVTYSDESDGYNDLYIYFDPVTE